MQVRPNIKGPKAYLLKKPDDLFPGTWHVTARFQVQIKTGVYISVVRLRHGVGPVKHFTTDEVERLFKPLEAS